MFGHIFLVGDDFKACMDSYSAMRTTGDGDCLLHAVMLSLCGREDTTALMRQLLVLTMTSSQIAAGLQELWQAAESADDAAMGFPAAREHAQLLKGYEQW